MERQCPGQAARPATEVERPLLSVRSAFQGSQKIHNRMDFGFAGGKKFALVQRPLLREGSVQTAQKGSFSPSHSQSRRNDFRVVMRQRQAARLSRSRRFAFPSSGPLGKESNGHRPATSRAEEGRCKRTIFSAK